MARISGPRTAIGDAGAADGSPRPRLSHSVTSRPAPALWLTLLAFMLASSILPAAAQAVGAVYVANGGNASVSQFTITGSGLLSPLSPVTVEASISPNGPLAVAITPDGKSAYVTSSENAVWQYDINQATGALSPKAPGTVATGNGLPHGGIAVTPDGKSTYVTNLSEGTVSQYDISPTGALSPKAAPTVATGKTPSGIAVTPDGKSAYVTNSEDKTVSQYTINAVNGELEAKSPATVAAGLGPTGVVVSPDGKSVYVHNAGTISQYDIDSEGKLSPKSPASVPAGISSSTDDTTPIAVSPDGRSLYSTDESNVSPRVLQFDIGSGGKLSPKSPEYLESEANVNPTNIALTSDGKSAYVTNVFGKSVSLYDINPVTGTLSPKTLAKVTVGEFPEGIAVGLPPLAHPTSTSVSCSPASVVAGNLTTCTATVTDTAPSGQVAPTGTVGFSSNGPGSFGSGGSCALAEAGPGVASCQVSYTPSATSTTPVRYDAITAVYNGDYLHNESSGSRSVQVLSIGLLASGSFVIGDQNATVGSAVTFWGAQWSKLNMLSGGEAPPSFKGFASATSANPPTCAAKWSTGTGASSGQPAAPLPGYMAVIVSSKVNKSGPTLSGSTEHVVVVKTDLGYASDPGHPGRGTVVATIC